MTVRRFLLFTPILLIFFLLQSYFWIPTFDQQSRGNPDRLSEFINASIGDASLLNPILSADSASSEIASLVFEGLIDRDEELRFRGRLAQSWEVYEEAYFYVNPDTLVPGKGPLAADELVKLLEDVKAGTLPVSPEAGPDNGIRNRKVSHDGRQFPQRRDGAQQIDPAHRQGEPVGLSLDELPRGH